MERMTFKSLKAAREYIGDKLPGGAYTICLEDKFVIVDENLATERAEAAKRNNSICSKIPYLRVNGEFL